MALSVDGDEVQIRVAAIGRKVRHRDTVQHPLAVRRDRRTVHALEIQQLLCREETGLLLVPLQHLLFKG
ncbi:MAG: hypothetical protein KFF77_12660 [Bacteroidetes bacterium]|nr:hypothetical protein [Bacteroidota bacterium]